MLQKCLMQSEHIHIYLLSSFMQSFSSGIVAKARPHLVHFLHINEISTFDLKSILV